MREKVRVEEWGARGGLGGAPAALGHLDGWGRRRRHLGTEQGPPSAKESTHHWLGSKGSDPGTQIFSLRSPQPSAPWGRWRAVPGREVQIVSQGGAPNLLARSCDVRKVKNGRKMTKDGDRMGEGGVKLAGTHLNSCGELDLVENKHDKVPTAHSPTCHQLPAGV